MRFVLALQSQLANAMNALAMIKLGSQELNTSNRTAVTTTTAFLHLFAVLFFRFLAFRMRSIIKRKREENPKRRDEEWYLHSTTDAKCVNACEVLATRFINLPIHLHMLDLHAIRFFFSCCSIDRIRRVELSELCYNQHQNHILQLYIFLVIFKCLNFILTG